MNKPPPPPAGYRPPPNTQPPHVPSQYPPPQPGQGTYNQPLGRVSYEKRKIKSWQLILIIAGTLFIGSAVLMGVLEGLGVIEPSSVSSNTVASSPLITESLPPESSFVESTPRAPTPSETLVSYGMSEGQANTFLNALAPFDAGEPAQGGAMEEGSHFAITMEESGFFTSVRRNYVVTFGEGDTIIDLEDGNGFKLYEEGNRNTHYYNGSILEAKRHELIADAQLRIEGVLKAPKTAEFAPTDEWQVGYNTDTNDARVVGYVDSQNSFGAMLRAEFALDYRYDNTVGEFSVVYAVFDGEAIFDER